MKDHSVMSLNIASSIAYDRLYEAEDDHEKYLAKKLLSKLDEERLYGRSCDGNLSQVIVVMQKTEKNEDSCGWEFICCRHSTYDECDKVAAELRAEYEEK
jgi:hypothetical protein